MKRQNKSFKIEYNAPAKDYLHILVSNFHFVKLLNSKNKSYESLYNWLENNMSILTDPETRYPTIATIAKELGIDGTKLKKQLCLIHDDIIELNHSNPILFKQNHPILASIFLKGLYANSYFNIGLQTLPSIGDRISFNLAKPITGNDLYYVSSISHDFSSEGHEICISTSVSEPYQYLRLLKEKAYLYGEISAMEFISREDYLFEKELLKMFKSL